MARKGIPVLDFDDLITAIQALSAPSATDVAVDPTGMEIITANNSQGALKQLDTAVDSVNSSLTQYIKRKFISIPSSTASGTYLTNDFTIDDGYEYLCTTQVLGQGFVPTIPIMVDDDTKRLWYQGTIPTNQSIKIIYLEKLSLS